ncbi:MAG: GNAT family N-acetyltransferase [Bacteriovoracaceae bacterium]|nr:GNAT family N-acetyltransferase [Bacteriovoracaceae bacterium]
MIVRLELFSNPFRNIFKLPRGWDIRFSPRFLAYTPTFDFRIETSRYLLETASTTNDLLEVFELRHKIFLEEAGASKVDPDGFDLDEFDSICDHIIIRSKEENKIVGTYRVISSLYSDDFYSQSEFELEEFLSSPGHKLELGRACIDRNHRNGAVIDLLWHGIGRYINLAGSRYLFGCSSLKITNPNDAKAVLNFFKKEGHFDNRYFVNPSEKFNMDIYKVVPTEMDDELLKSLIPPLLRSYFTAGAKVYGEPALDREFNCIDFLTILDMENLSPSFKRRYFKSL